MRVTVVSSNLSSNALGRAYLLAKVIQRNHDVEIVGPTFGDGIWPPCDLPDVTYKTVAGANFPKFFSSAKKLHDFVDADIVYAVKPRPSSFGIGLWVKKTKGIPLILDIDDWDQQGAYNLPLWRRVGRLSRLFYDPYANAYIPLMEKQITRANAVTVVSRLLQEKFGGVYLPHGRDTDYLNPANFSGREICDELGIGDERIIMFLGTPKPHKGLEELVRAATMIEEFPVLVVIVGANMTDPYTEKLRSLGGERVRFVGMQPFHRIPHFLAAAQVVALPQRNLPFAQAQVPAKVFDAMAMARPIVATNVGDLPEILHDCALIVPADDVNSLSLAMKKLLADPALSQELGMRARQKCIDHYSWDVMENTLEQLFADIT